MIHEKLTLDCKYCNQAFVVPYGKRHRLYCGRSCQSKAISRTDIRKTSLCVVCKKEFKHYGERIVCSTDCNSKYMSEMRIGENNPYYNHDKILEAECQNCQNKFQYTRAGQKTGYDPRFCTKKCWDIFQRGKNKSLDGPAVHGSPYPQKFPKIKTQIRKRDNWTCGLCGTYKPTCNVRRCGIAVHHIDYDKANCDPENLICLCDRCHGLTNFNRGYWQVLFVALMSGSKIVRKGWGVEIHIVNNDKYCLKYLVFFKGKKFSLHYHDIKQELWHCIFGKFDLFLDESKSNPVRFKAGGKIELLPSQVHQLFALENSMIVEVSTRDFPEDSIRLERGD